MSKYFAMAKKYYEDGRWNKAQIAHLVEIERLTAEEYEEITGEPYED